MVEIKVFVRFFLLSFLSLQLIASQLTSESYFDKPAPEWREGPIRYILTPEEDAEYRQLGTESERQAFIRNFWAHLDPILEESNNQRRTQYWRRVDQANNLFHDPILHGWKSDRGKAYILLGPPNEVQLLGEEEIWIYWTLPLTERPYESRLVFRRSTTGMMRLSQPPLRRSQGSHGRGETPLEESLLSRVLNEGGAQLIPGRFVISENSVKAEYYFPALNPACSYRTYRADDGMTLVVMDIYFPEDQFSGHIPPRSGPDVGLTAAIASVNDREQVVSFSKPMHSSSEHLEGFRGPKSFQASFELRPGVYKGVFTLVERWSHFGASFDRTMLVPDYQKVFSLSSVTITRPPEKPQDKSPDSVAFAYYSQGDKAFMRGETLYLSFRVYNATEMEGGPDVQVEYRFGRKVRGKADEIIHQVAYHRVRLALLSHSQPLDEWPEGDYTVEINVVDNHTGASATAQADFVVVAVSKLSAAFWPASQLESPGSYY